MFNILATMIQIPVPESKQPFYTRQCDHSGITCRMRSISLFIACFRC